MVFHRLFSEFSQFSHGTSWSNIPQLCILLHPLRLVWLRVRRHVLRLWRVCRALGVRLRSSGEVRDLATLEILDLPCLQSSTPSILLWRSRAPAPDDRESVLSQSLTS